MWLRGKGYNWYNANSSSFSYIPKQGNNSDPTFCNCGFQKASTDNKCIICSNSPPAEIEASVTGKEGKTLISIQTCSCPLIIVPISESFRAVFSVRFEVGVSLLIAPAGADKRGPKAPFPLVENAGMQPEIHQRVPAGALVGARSYLKYCSECHIIAGSLPEF